MRTVEGLDALKALVGQDLGQSKWRTITQERIDQFAEVTEDRQWIHIDREKAAKSPLGGTIAHGYLVLSMLPAMMAETVTYEGWSAKMNYGLDRLRFTAPVPAGGRIRANLSLKEVEETSTGVRVRMGVTVELENASKPACVAETLALLIP